MTKEDLAKSLKQLHSDLEKITNKPASAMFKIDAMIPQYNRLLVVAKALHPEVSSIQAADPVPEFKTTMVPESLMGADREAQNLKTKAADLPIALGIETQEPQPAPPQVPTQVITIQQIQHAAQQLSLELEQVTSILQQSNIEQGVKDEALKSVRAFNEEITKAKPDPRRVKDSLDIVLRAGKEFVLPLLLKVLENWDKISPK